MVGQLSKKLFSLVGEKSKKANSYFDYAINI